MQWTDTPYRLRVVVLSFSIPAQLAGYARASLARWRATSAIPAFAEHETHARTWPSSSANTRTNRSEMCAPQWSHFGIGFHLAGSLPVLHPSRPTTRNPSQVRISFWETQRTLSVIVFRVEERNRNHPIVTPGCLPVRRRVGGIYSRRFSPQSSFSALSWLRSPSSTALAINPACAPATNPASTLTTERTEQDCNIPASAASPSPPNP